jgi:hypothetical protein
MKEQSAVGYYYLVLSEMADHVTDTLKGQS